MRRKMEQLRNGKFEYSLPRLVLSQTEIELLMRPGERYQGEIFFQADNKEKIKGYIHSSSRRVIPAAENFSGTAIALPYGIDCVGLKEGDSITGQITFISNVGEYAVPFHIEIRQEEVKTSRGKVENLKDFAALAEKNYREAFRLFTGEHFARLLPENDAHMLALYQVMNQNPVSYQHVEEFMIAAGLKAPVEISLKEEQISYQEVTQSHQDVLTILKRGWGHLRLEVETEGEFLYVQKRTISEEDFIGSAYPLEYIVQSHKLGVGKSRGRILIRSPYKTWCYEVTASRDADMQIHMETYEKRQRVRLYRDFLNLHLHKLDYKTWYERTMHTLDELNEAGCGYPIYQVYEAYVHCMNEEPQKASEILMQYQDKSFTKEDLELAGLYLFVCYKNGLLTNKENLLNKLNSLHRQQQESFPLLWVLLQVDDELRLSGGRVKVLYEQQYRLGCFSPLLYYKAYRLVEENPDLLDRMDDFWTQVMYFAAKEGMITEELAMRIAYLSGYAKTFKECLYKVLTMAYGKYPTKDTLEAICKLIMKDRPGRKRYFPWFERAVEQNLHLTRLYECYIESIDERFQRILPKTIRKYFAYNNSLSDNQKAFVYANVVRHRQEDMSTYENYRKTIHDFAFRKLKDGKMNEDYAVLYQEMARDIHSEEEREALGHVVFTSRLYCDDPKVREVVVRQSQLAREEIYPCIRGIAYPRIYTEDVVIAFQDSRKRRYAATIDYNLRPLFDEETTYICRDQAEPEDGFLLHYCNGVDGVISIDDENVMQYRQLSQSDGFTDNFRRKILRHLLDYYVRLEDAEKVDSYLRPEDYREFAKVDKARLIQLLIFVRRFSQAYEILCEYGAEDVEDKALLKLCSRIILKNDFAEDDELLALADEVFHRGIYDEVILHYMMVYNTGTCRDLFELWERAKGFEMDTYQLEEKILVQLVFSENYNILGADVLENYVKQHGNEDVIVTYLTFLSYGHFVHGKPLAPYVQNCLERAYEREQPMDMICKATLLKIYASRGRWSSAQEQNVKLLLADCCRHGLYFAFFRKLPPQLLAVCQLDDKVIAEYRGNPQAKVMIYYALDHGLGVETQYQSEPLKSRYQGYFNKTFTLFYGETLHYYFEVENDDHVDRTQERTVQAASASGETQTKYQLINQMLAARKFGRTSEVKEKIAQYRRQERYVEKLFSIKKEG